LQLLEHEGRPVRMDELLERWPGHDGLPLTTTAT
jgi:hypothetical protein